MGNTKIEWANKVWNPVTGCSKISEGCRYCYAAEMAKRFWGARQFGQMQFHPERLAQPASWKTPARVFVDSMSDLFHPGVAVRYIAAVFNVMAEQQRHTYLILTKRAKRMYDVLSTELPFEVLGNWAADTPISLAVRNGGFPLKNVWLGVSVENQERADERIPWLLSTSAAKRFISYEPALGAIDLTRYEPFCKLRGGAWSTAGKLARILDGKIDWVIMGAESGRQARPMNDDWARLVRGQCWATEVPFFLKQMWVDGKLAKMPALDGKTWSQIPEG